MTTITDKRQLLGLRWELDSERSQIGFRVPNYWGLMKVKGTFDTVRGALDLSDPERPLVDLRIDASSVHTRNSRRDQHLRSGAFFDVEHGSELRFASHAVTIDDGGEGLLVAGELHVRGQVVPLELTATVETDGDELRLRASTELDHRQLGMTYSPLGMIRTPSTLYIDARIRAEVQS